MSLAYLTTVWICMLTLGYACVVFVQTLHVYTVHYYVCYSFYEYNNMYYKSDNAMQY